MGVLNVPLIFYKIFINAAKISGGIMEDLQLMYDVMSKSLDKDYDKDFDNDVSDVSKVLDWLREFELDNYDKIKFLNKWNR